MCVCVCVCVHQLVSTLTAEPFDLRTQNSVEGLTLTKSRISSKVKVTGQSRHFLKYDFRMFLWYDLCRLDRAFWLWHKTSWRHVTSQHDVLTSFKDILARILTKRARRGRARQRSGIFIRFKMICVPLLFLLVLPVPFFLSPLSSSSPHLSFSEPPLLKISPYSQTSHEGYQHLVILNENNNQSIILLHHIHKCAFWPCFLLTT